MKIKIKNNFSHFLLFKNLLYILIILHIKMTSEKVIKEIKDLFNTYGSLDYIGESLTQLEHAVQAGISAMQDNDLHKYDNYLRESVIIAAFLHDIGHLIGMSKKEFEMVDEQGNLGIQNHEILGSQWLKSKGFSNFICNLVKNHVPAKRYLCTIDEKYRNKLSDASLRTLQLQGGLMTTDEVKQFRLQPFPELCIKIRLYDDKAKIINGLGGLDSYEFKENMEKLYDIIKKIFRNI